MPIIASGIRLTPLSEQSNLNLILLPEMLILNKNEIRPRDWYL